MDIEKSAEEPNQHDAHSNAQPGEADSDMSSRYVGVTAARPENGENGMLGGCKHNFQFGKCPEGC